MYSLVCHLNVGLFWQVSFGLKPWVTCRRVCKSHHDHDWGKISLVPLFVEAAVACGLSARYCLLLPGSQSPYSLSASEDKLLEARSSQNVILSHAGSQSMPSSYWNGKYFVSPPRSALWHCSTSGAYVLLDWSDCRNFLGFVTHRALSGPEYAESFDLKMDQNGLQF